MSQKTFAFALVLVTLLSLSPGAFAAQDDTPRSDFQTSTAVSDKASDVPITDKFVSDEFVSDKFVSDRPITDKRITDRRVTDHRITDKRPSDVRPCTDLTGTDLAKCRCRLLYDENVDYNLCRCRLLFDGEVDVCRCRVFQLHHDYLHRRCHPDRPSDVAHLHRYLATVL